MAGGGGKRAGARRGARQGRSWRPDVLGYAAAATIAVVGWGLLVWLAIRSGTQARGGDGRHWIWLGLASVGAIICLFAAMMLLARVSRALGITSAPPVDRVSHSHAAGSSAHRTPPTTPAEPPSPRESSSPREPSSPHDPPASPPASLTDTAERPAVRAPGHRAAR